MKNLIMKPTPFTVGIILIHDALMFSAASAADFEATPFNGTPPLLVQFTDTSTECPFAWTWKFGDGATSTDQNSTHTSTLVRTYNVTLITIHADGSDGEEKTRYIQVLDSSQPTLRITPQVLDDPVGTTREFSLTMTSLPSGLTGSNMSVRLLDLATSEVTGITLPAWASCNLRSPVPGDLACFSSLELERSAEAGTTNVPLGTVAVRGDTLGRSQTVVAVTAMDSDGGGLIASSIVNDPLNMFQPVPLTADVSVDNTTGYFPLAFRFTDLSTGVPAPSGWPWSIDDSTATSTERNPVHTYRLPGLYNVTMRVENDQEQVTVTKVWNITVSRNVVPFPGYTDEPLDPDDDGLYEDVNGNCRLDYDDFTIFYYEVIVG